MTTQPATVSFYENLGITAARRASRVGGGLRAYFFGKALDVNGLGMIRREDLQAFALQLGVNLRTWQRWVNEARNNDLFTDIQKGDDWYFIMPSPARAAFALGLDSVGSRKITIPAAAIVGKGWKARITAAWEDGKQISREQIQKTINVSVRTQTYRASQMGSEYTRRRNYCQSKLSASHIHIVKELGTHKAPFVSKGLVYWRLPDLRFSSDVLKKAKGRARKVNKSIRSHSQNCKGLSNMRRALSSDSARETWVKLFNQSEAQLKQSIGKVSKSARTITELYQFSHEGRTRNPQRSPAGIWKDFPAFVG